MPWYALWVAILTVVSIGGPAGAQDLHYRRTDRYIYIETPTVLTFDPDQRKALAEATEHIRHQLLTIRPLNPRSGWRGKMDEKFNQAAALFASQIDEVIKYCDKYYGVAEDAGYRYFHASPTGFMFFFGQELKEGAIIKMGGSFTLGVVMVPVHVERIDIETGESSQFISFDTALIAYPAANFGISANPKISGVETPNFRVGGGVIWGRLDHAADFRGLVFGPSGTFTVYHGLNFKLQFLKNWSKPGAVSNVFVTLGLEQGTPSAGVEAHGNVSYIIDGEAFLKKLGNPMDAFLDKFGFNKSLFGSETTQ